MAENQTKLQADLGKIIVADKQTSLDRKTVIELLEIVFNEPSCITVQAWLEKNQPTAGRPFPLVPSNVEETFFSKEKNKKFIKRKREDFTPLAGAAISGDNFLVRKLLEFIPDHLKYEAGLLLKKTKESEDYLKPFKNLEAAYEELNKKLSNQPINHSTWPELDKFELQIAVRQQELPAYGIQEYCDDEPFDSGSPPRVDKEPKRSYLDLDKNEIDMALIGSSSILYKSGYDAGWGGLGQGEGAIRKWGACVLNVASGASRFRKVLLINDLRFISHLCKVCSLELDSIIQGLLQYKPKSEEPEAQIEVSNEKSRNKVRV